MNKLSNFFLYAFISAALFYLAALANEQHEKSKWKQCGEIIHMKTGFDIVEHRIKNRTTAELKNLNIIVMDFDGDIQSEEVSDDTYYRHKQGDRICFYRWSHDWNFALCVLIISFFVLAVITICKLFKLLF